MTQDNNQGRKRVFRQAWKPTVYLRFLHGLWNGVYSAFKIFAGALATVFVITAVCVLGFVTILANYFQEEIIPTANVQLDSFDLEQNSYVYYLNGDDIEILQKVYSSANRDWVSFENIPEDLIHATVAIEDHRFFQHQGVDWVTTIKACLNMFMGGSSEFGGSTITQQLIKNVFKEDSFTVQRKVLEIFRAAEFERLYDKKVILEWYLNIIFFGQNCYGVKAAAENYYGKELELLTTAECASLISITNNPSLFNPYRTTLDKDGKTGAEKNRERQVNTLYMMKEYGYLSESEYQEAYNQDIVFKSGIDAEDKLAVCVNSDCGYRGAVGSYVFKDEVHYCPRCGTEASFDKDASQYVYSWFVDTVLEDVAQQLAEQNGVEWNEESKKVYMEVISRGGYHIYSTLDMNVQQQVDTIYTNLDEIPEDRSVQQLQSAMVVIDNRTGDIVAMAGGVGEKENHDAFNRATDAKLQPGSSLKPISVYAPAFELGVITPATVISDLPLYYTKETAFPKNDDLAYAYKRVILTGVTSSVNAIAVNTLDRIGTSYSFDFAKNNFRLSTLVDTWVDRNGKVFSDINYSPLGMGAPTKGVTVRDLAAAYGTFANNGEYREGRTFLKVYNSDGELVIDNEQSTEQILSEKAVEYMNFCLDATADIFQGGSGYNGDIEGQDVAAKTGTTTGTKDRWYCGYTGYYTCAVWVGYDMPETVVLVGDLTNPAGRLFKKVMAPIHEGKERIPLFDKDNFVTVSVCLDCGNLATDACKYDPRSYDSGTTRVATSKVYPEDVPDDVCNCHVMVDFCKECNAVANEYCKLMAKAGQTVLVKRALVKMTADGVNELKLASEYGLYKSHLSDNFIWLVDENGKDKDFFGIFDDANEGCREPYLICGLHTKEMWEEFLEKHPGYNTQESVGVE